MRRAVPAQVQNRKNFSSVPAPVRGWIENDNLAANGGNGCSVLENWFPEAATVRMRAGALRKTPLGEPLQGMIPYRSGLTEKLFACSETNIYDVTTFPETAPYPSWALTTSGRWSYTQMVTSGGEYAVAVNGHDLMIYYDGTAWNPIAGTAIVNVNYNTLSQNFLIGRTVTGGASGATGVIAGVRPTSALMGSLRLRAVSGTFQSGETLTGDNNGGAAVAASPPTSVSSIAITGVQTETLSHVWQFSQRLWFAQGGTTKVWYLDANALGGAATSMELGGLFSQGGAILFGASWSSDSGSGFAERCVFVSDQGEVLVFEGDPAFAPTGWGIVGRYQIGKPIGTQVMRTGGDLILCTEDGLVAMSNVVSLDRAALASSAMTFPIEPAWRLMHRTNLDGLPVQIEKWQSHSMAIVGWPHRNGTDTYVVNLITGAWAKWVGLDVQCMALHQGWIYFGTGDGVVLQMEASGYDDGQAYVCRLSMLPQHLGAPGAFKIATQARATFQSMAPFTPKLSVAENYGRNFPVAPSAAPDAGSSSLWDVATWDVSLWDDGPDSETRVTALMQWVSVGASGFSLSPQVQVTCGGERKPDAELIAMDLAYLVGGYVV